MQILLSILLGILPQTIYFYSGIVFAKGKPKNNPALLFMSIFAVVFAFAYLYSYSIYTYLLLVVVMECLVVIFYKKFLPFDFSLLLVLMGNLSIINILFYISDADYMNAAIACAIWCIVVNIITQGLIERVYQGILDNWNRKRNPINKPRIKSLTARNIIVLLTNISLIIINYVLLYVLQQVQTGG